MSTTILRPIIQRCIEKGHVTNEDSRAIRDAIGQYEDAGERELRESLVKSSVTYESEHEKFYVAAPKGISRKDSFMIGFESVVSAPASMLSANTKAAVFIGVPLAVALLPITSVLGAMVGGMRLFMD
jgi:hypothetical protein